MGSLAEGIATVVAGEVATVVAELIDQLQESVSGPGGVLAPIERGVQ